MRAGRASAFAGSFLFRRALTPFYLDSIGIWSAMLPQSRPAMIETRIE
jgi:hypothetical protein